MFGIKLCCALSEICTFWHNETLFGSYKVLTLKSPIIWNTYHAALLEVLIRVVSPGKKNGFGNTL